MDFKKIAQELNKTNYVELVKQTYSKVYELANDIETNPNNQNQNANQFVQKILEAENKFGVAANQCKDKQTLLVALNALKAFYTLTTSCWKSGKIKLNSRYSIESLNQIAANYTALTKMV